MIGLVITLDYEVYGTGVGDFRKQMIFPTAELLNLAHELGVRVTIMAEAAEILALRRERSFLATVDAIECQLVDAIAAGHDVQLHLHPAWFKARYNRSQWELAFDEYGLPSLSADTVREYVAVGKQYLDDLGRRVSPDYECVAFRAGGWLVQPSATIAAALTAAGILIDTSVFKGGHGTVGRYRVDFRAAPSAIFPWLADPADMSRVSSQGQLLEIPIFCRQVPVWSMLTRRRLGLQRQLGRRSRHSCAPGSSVAGGQRLRKLALRYPKKFDYCRSTCPELMSFARQALMLTRDTPGPVPVIAIGHSTEFTDDGVLRRFIEGLRREHGHEVTYQTLAECAR